MDRADIQENAKSIAKTLKERNKHAIGQIERLIELMGIDFVQEILAETQHIEARDGIKTHDGKRRRTAGGVFFYLVKPKLTPEQRVIVFPPIDWKKRRDKKKAKEKGAKAKAKQIEQTPVKEKPSPTKVEAPSVSSKPSPDLADKLAKLEAAAQTLRERLTEMEAKGQKGIAMTKTLLKNTEKQIAALQRTSDG